jgi:hypothetical protein
MPPFSSIKACCPSFQQIKNTAYYATEKATGALNTFCSALKNVANNAVYRMQSAYRCAKPMAYISAVNAVKTGFLGGAIFGAISGCIKGVRAGASAGPISAIVCGAGGALYGAASGSISGAWLGMKVGAAVGLILGAGHGAIVPEDTDSLVNLLQDDMLAT